MSERTRVGTYTIRSLISFSFALTFLITVRRPISSVTLSLSRARKHLGNRKGNAVLLSLLLLSVLLLITRFFAGKKERKREKKRERERAPMATKGNRIWSGAKLGSCSTSTSTSTSTCSSRAGVRFVSFCGFQRQRRCYRGCGGGGGQRDRFRAQAQGRREDSLASDMTRTFDTLQNPAVYNVRYSGALEEFVLTSILAYECGCSMKVMSIEVSS